MSDLRQTLTDVLSGKLAPEKFLEAVDEYLAKPNANLDALRSAIDAAEHLGLREDIAKAARERIVAGGAEKTQMMDDDAQPDDAKTVLTTNKQETKLRADPADVDPDRTVATGGDPERTVAMDTSGDPDKTVAMDHDDDATVQVGGGDPDATVQVGGHDPDATVQVGGGEGTVADDPFAMAASPGPAGGEEHGPGSVLKDRFRLEQVIGQGGMGAVYKAVDLLKVEARDRNPYIAVKLLVGDFKEHPEAFIALQRESAKAQRLAHPNIATVYDFDRDGETVYMTMELMVGAELAKYIKKLPAGGLPVEEANKIIEQLCAGLAYAHGRGLVHSDFKPGNAFMLEDGTVKLLDFGIARASKTKADAEGEATVFDPGQLGALTPAYATIEMFEGEDPDPRDDIYALACVAYELYTGKHPFNKMSAVKARDKGLKPAPVQKLNKRQNRTLLKGLALARADRIASVEEFWEGLKPRKDYTLQIAAAATAGVLLVGVLAYNPVVDYIHGREHQAITAELTSGDESRLVAALAQMDELTPERRRAVVDIGNNDVVIREYFQARAEAQINHAEGRYNYAAALQELAPLDQYMPDSAAVENIRRDIQTRRSQFLADLREDFDLLLEDGRLMPDPEAQDLTEIVAIVRQVNPESDMLTNINVTTGYRELVDAALAADNWNRAAEVLDVGLDYAPQNPELLDLESRVSTELRRREEAARVATLQQTLRDAAPQTLDEFREVREELRELRELRPADELVASYDVPLRQAFARAMADATSSGDWAQADQLLADFATVLPLDYLTNTRQTITQRQMQAGVDTSEDAARAADLTQRAESIRQLLADGSFDDDFARQLNREYKEYVARTTSDTDEWETLRSEIAMAHIERARELVAANRFGTAGNLLEEGQIFHPTLPEFGTVRETLAAAESAYRAQVARQQEIQRIEDVKSTVRAQAEARQMGQALQAFNELRNQLPADDAFITTEGPAILADGYAAAATQAAEEERYGTAADLARAGLQVLPGSDALQQLLARYQPLADRAEVAELARSLTPRNFAAFRTRYNEVRNSLAGNERGAFDDQIARVLSARLTQLDGQNQRQDATELKRLALELLPGNARIAQTTVREPERPSRFAPQITAAIEANNLTEARRLLNEGLRAEPGHSQLAGFDAQITQLEREATALYTRAQQTLQRGDRNGAQNLLNQALAIWADSPQITAWRDQAFTVTTAPQRADDGSRACASNLAGLGTSNRALCFDMVSGSAGPRLVVVPGISGGQPFAIGKFEVSVSDWNHYCSSSGACQPRGSDDDRLLPVTGITFQQAEAYAAWLTANSNGTYRIPTDAEWRHAANANGNPGSSADNNCRVVQGGNVIVGATLRNINTSSDNGWGVRNHVGNAREWTRGGSLQARGGAHTTPLTECSVDLVEPHSGNADAVTGFRVARNADN